MALLGAVTYRPGSRRGCSYSPDPEIPLCGEPPAFHLGVDMMDGLGVWSLYTCVEHVAFARSEALVVAEHLYIERCAVDGAYRWLWLACGDVVCDPIAAPAAP